jgi:hypothetical protein
LSPVDPTATHTLTEGHDTAVNESPPGAGLGVVRIDHVVPFHRSASVRVPPAIDADPTAMHSFAAGQETPPNDAAVAPLGLGGICTCQVAVTAALAWRPVVQMAIPTAATIPAAAVHLRGEKGRCAWFPDGIVCGSSSFVTVSLASVESRRSTWRDRRVYSRLNASAHATYSASELTAEGAP